MNTEDIHKEWQNCLDKGYTVVMDNDSWWFVDNSSEDDDEPNHWVGGFGPYGRDLLEYILNKHYNGMKMV